MDDHPAGSMPSSDHIDAGGPPQVKKDRRSEVIDQGQSMGSRDIYGVPKQAGRQFDENNNDEAMPMTNSVPITKASQVNNQMGSPSISRSDHPDSQRVSPSRFGRYDSPTGRPTYQRPDDSQDPRLARTNIQKDILQSAPVTHSERTMKETVPDVLKQVTVQRVSEDEPSRVPDVINEAPISRFGQQGTQKDISAGPSPSERLMHKVYQTSPDTRRYGDSPVDGKGGTVQDGDVRDMRNILGLRSSPPKEVVQDLPKDSALSRTPTETSPRYGVTRESGLRRSTPDRVTPQGSPASPQSPGTVAHGDTMAGQKPHHVEANQAMPSVRVFCSFMKEKSSKNFT